MSAGSPLDRLHDAAIRVQLPLVLAAVPVTTALYALAAIPIATDIVLAESGSAAADAAARAARVVVGALLACVALTTCFAAMLLRGSIRAAVQRLQQATDAIARGDFRHRVASPRGDELGSLAASIDLMAERLERLEQARRRVLACVSHELRTPLTIIQGTAFTLGREEVDPVSRVRLELIQQETTSLARLVGDLVEAASLHAGGVRLEVERSDLRELVHQQVDRFRHDAVERGVEIRVAGATAPTWVDLDADRMSQVLTNLLANAVRHAPRGSTIDVSLVVDGRPGACSIHVANDCAPIDPEIARHIFEPFVQGDARTGSVGLGLAIVEALVTAHGGTVSIDEEAAVRGRAHVSVVLAMRPGPVRAPRAARRRAAVVAPVAAVADA